MSNHLTTTQLLEAMRTARSNWEALLNEHIAAVRAWLDRVAVR